MNRDLLDKILDVFPKKLKIFLADLNDKEYFIRRTLNRRYTFRKTGPGSLEKGDPLPKIQCVSQRPIFDKLDGANFKYDSSF